MKKAKVLVSLHTQDNDFQTAQALAAKEAAYKLGMDVEIVFADNNAVCTKVRRFSSRSRIVPSPGQTQLCWSQ